MDIFSDINARIMSLEKELRDWKARRNSLMPMCTFPAEIIVKIIRELQCHAAKPLYLSLLDELV
jgi:hypothetical protein